MPAMNPFPGQPVAAGDDRRDLVAKIQGRLNALGSGPLDVDGSFGSATRSAVLLFQTRRHLLADGVVGAHTWSELFAENFPPARPAPQNSSFSAQLLRVAGAEVGVRESGGPNRGPRVDEYIRNVGLDPTRGSFSWCAAFVYYCFTRTAVTLGVNNPCPKSAGVLMLWAKAPAWSKIRAGDVASRPDVVEPGSIFIVDHSGGKGHTGLVEKIGAGSVHTIEGNTDDSGGREGDGVYRRIRSFSEINTGFIDFALTHTATADGHGAIA
jgi:hypothetical protein